MEKKIIHLLVPAINQEYDIYIPAEITIKELTELIGRAVEEVSGKQYISSRTEFLCLQEKSLVLVQEATVQSYDIQNGDHIVII